MTDTRAGALSNVEDVYPLTPVQEGMLFHTISEPGSGVYVDQISGRLVGHLDVPSFREAWEAVVHRHTALRTVFVWDGVEEPLQVVRSDATIELREPEWVRDWPSASESRRAELVERLLADDRTNGFDVARAPLLRLWLWRDGDDAWRFIWSFHHLIVDGWSARVVLDEVLTVHAALLAGGNVESAELATPTAFRDHVAHLLGRAAARDETLWREELSGFTTPTPLAAPVPTHAGGPGQQFVTVLDADATAAAKRMAVEQRITLSTLVQGAWALVLQQWAHESDVVFGVTVAGRPPELPGIESAVGMYINTVPMRVRVPDDVAAADWLRDLQRHQLGLREVELTSLAAIQRWSEIPAGEALFESLLVVENVPDERGAAGALRLDDVRFDEQSNYPLAMLVVPGDRLELLAVYDGARFEESWIASVTGHLARVVERLAASAATPLAALDLIADSDRTSIDGWNGRPSASIGTDRSIVDSIRRAAERDPDGIAAIAAGSPLSKRDLVRRADELAHRLHARGVRPGDLVGLSVERSIDLPIGIVGILAAGAGYVPLDPSYPEARNAAVVADAGITTIVSDEDIRACIAGADGPPEVEPDPDRTAYVIYTSGSTGRPKGVVVTHRTLIHSTAARDEHYGSGPERFLLLSSFAFDSSIVGLFWTMCTGGTLVLPAPGDEQDMERLAEIVSEHEVTHLLALPSLYGLLLEAAATRLGSLRVAIVAGEACPPTVVDRHRTTLPHAELHNEYGPTEATVWATAARLDTPIAGAGDPSNEVTIGGPIAGTQVHIVDPAGRRVPVGFPGELWIGGAGVAAGYLGRSDLTAERFVDIDIGDADGVSDSGSPDRRYRTGDLVRQRPDGQLVYLGRADEQVKVRGHRIETAEIEAVIDRLDGIDESAVVGYDLRGRTQLVAYATGRRAAAEAEIRTDLGGVLPEFMVPSRIVALEALPRTASGKLDRRALPDPTVRTATTERAPRSATERTLAELFRVLLGLDEVGVDDDYFELGGDSIVSIQLISRARHAGLHLEPRDVARHPTIAGLAAVADAAADGDSTAVVTDDGVTFGLAPVQEWFFALELDDPHHWNQSQLFELPADVDLAAVRNAVATCIAHHPQLRARFSRVDGSWCQRIEPDADDIELIVVDDESQLYAAQAMLDLETGPVVTARALRRPGGRLELLLVVHHLVVDVVSWSMLLDDLESAYRQAVAGTPIALPAASAPYSTVVASRPDATPWTGPVIVPTDHPGRGNGTEDTAAVASVELDSTLTNALLVDAPARIEATAEDLLATAAAQAISSWTGAATVRLGVEGHGRPDDTDVSRTVGWFTDLAAIDVTIDPGADTSSQLKAVKEAMRSGRERGGSLPAVNLNFLGRAPASTTGTFRPVPGAEPTSRAGANERPHMLDIVAAVRDGTLTIDVHYSTARHLSSTANALAEGVRSRLAGLLGWATTTDRAVLTPSDFAESGLDQSELDDFFDDLL